MSDPASRLSYSVWQYLGVTLFGLVGAGAFLGVGWVRDDQPVMMVSGAVVFGLLLVLLAQSDRFRGGPPLQRQGDRLTGQELRQPLALRAARYQLQPYEGGWRLILLPRNGEPVHLQPGGWKINGHAFTPEALEALLREWGLSPAETKPSEPKSSETEALTPEADRPKASKSKASKPKASR